MLFSDLKFYCHLKMTFYLRLFFSTAVEIKFELLKLPNHLRRLCTFEHVGGARYRLTRFIDAVP